MLPEDLEVLAAFEAAAAVGFFTYDLYDPVAARTIADALEQAGRELRAESNDGTPEADAYDDLLQTFQDWRNGVIRDEHP